MIRWDRHISRRRFFREAADAVMTGAMVATLTGYLGPIAHVYFRDGFTKESSDEEVRKARERIKKRHGVSVHVGTVYELPSGGKKVYLQPVESAYIRMCAILEFEKIINVYPPDTVGKFITDVFLAQFLGDEKSCGFLADNKNQIAIRLWNVFSSHESLFGRLIPQTTSHHEIGHGVTKGHTVWGSIDYRDFAELNPASAYLGIFFERYYPDTKVNDLIPGFARAYGCKEAFEDIATIIELLFKGSKAVENRLKIEDDKLAPKGSEWHGVLRKKVDRVKMIIQKKIPEMDEQFWHAIGTEKMTDPVAYWDGRFKKK